METFYKADNISSGHYMLKDQCSKHYMNELYGFTGKDVNWRCYGASTDNFGHIKHSNNIVIQSLSWNMPLTARSYRYK